MALFIEGQALVIGVREYDDAQLSLPVFETQAVAQALMDRLSALTCHSMYLLWPKTNARAPE